MNDTITAISTAVGNSGISIIRISGDEAFNIAGKLMKLSSTDVERIKTHTIKYGHIYNETERHKESYCFFIGNWEDTEH